MIAYGAVAMSLEATRKRHAVQHVSAAGLAALALTGTLFVSIVTDAITSAFLGSAGSASFNGPLGWELVALVGCRRGRRLRRRPARARSRVHGTGVLVLFIAEAALPAGETSLVGWPLVLLLGAVAAVAAVVVTEGS